MRACRLVPLTVVLLCAATAPAAQEGPSSAELAAKAAGRDRGFCLVVGETDGRLTAALASGGGFYVQGCTRDAAAVDPARRALADAGVAARASIVLREADFLPYADNLINLVVCPDFKAAGVPIAEVVRVLAPDGVAVLGNAAGVDADLAAAGVKEHAALPQPGWVRLVKPVDPGLGVWTQLKGGSDQSYVSDDTVVAPWKEIRWIGDPRWGSLYMSYAGLVTAGGRVYYKENRAADGGNEWQLVARDAWNGCELWRVRSGSIWFKTYDYTDETLTCDDQCVFLVEDKTLTARDGRTGKVQATYDPGFQPKVVTSCGKVLVASTTSRCTALDKISGKVLWGRACDSHPASADGKAWVAAAGQLEAVELDSGKSLWKRPVEGLPEKPSMTMSLTVMHKAGVVYVVSAERWKPIGQVAALDAKDGKLLWKRDGRFSHGVLPFEHEVWCLSRDPKNKEDNMAALVLDSRTGEPGRQFKIKGTVMAKCWGARATTQCILYSNGWYVNRSSGDGLSNPATRSPCGLGQYPANGLTYYMPHHCDCKVTLRGFLALSGPGERRWFADEQETGSPRLFTSAGQAPAAKAEPSDWPTYRADIRRSDSTSAALPEKLALLWSQQIGATPLTQATAAGGLIYTAEPASRRVFARDAATGEARWSFVADGRVNHPPTLDKGLCLFGTGAGSVYCLDAATGRELWRLRAAPVQKFIGVEGQFDSPWPVAGSVLVVDGVAYLSAGRSSSQSGGLWLLAVEAATGKVKWRVRGGGSGDMFVSDGKSLRHTGVFYNPADGSRLPGGKEIPGILYCTRYLNSVSVVDYMATVEPSLSYKKHIELTDGRIKGDCIAFNDKTSVAGWRYTPGTPGWNDKSKTNKYFMYAAGQASWNVFDTRQHIMGIVLTEQRAYVAGRPTSYNPRDRSELWVVSLADGKSLQVLPLEGVPTYDGLSAAGGRLYLATEDGRLCCFGPGRD
ncbi:MAG: Outer membrane protein assembly factor BamB [Phycisphaerae bacterium]|nr:Outer membrane protein assembly factor BamB [Phycisphaerae bacterium]